MRLFILNESDTYVECWPVSYHKTKLGAYKELRKRCLDKHNKIQKDRMLHGKNKLDSNVFGGFMLPIKPYPYLFFITEENIKE